MGVEWQKKVDWSRVWQMAGEMAQMRHLVADTLVVAAAAVVVESLAVSAVASE